MKTKHKFRWIDLIMAVICFSLFTLAWSVAAGLPILAALPLAALMTGGLWFSLSVVQAQEAPPLRMHESTWNEDELTKADEEGTLK